MVENREELTLMAVHAHPDDESIGTGGILAKYSALGMKTVVVYGTRGEAGGIQNPEFVPPSPAAKIEDIRAVELEKALKVLRVGSTHFLGYRDSGMAGTPENLDPRSFAQADMEEAVARLVKIIRSTRPHVIVTYNEKGVYGHPDHVMAHRVTTAAFQASGDSTRYPEEGLEPWRPAKLYYTAIPRSRLVKMEEFLRGNNEEPGFDPDYLGTPDEKITTTIDVKEYLPLKIEALNCHQSQVGPHSFFRRLPPEFREEAFGFEHYICANGCDGSDRKETDLFEGLI